MRTTNYLAALTSLLVCLSATAQKKPLDHSVYDGWQRVASPAVSPDGSIVSWSVLPQEGDGTLYIRNAAGNTLEIPRGTSLSVSPDSKWAYCIINAEFAATRQAKIEKKKAADMPKDTLAIVDLSNFNIKKIAGAKSFRTGQNGMPYLVYPYDKGIIAVNPSNGEVDSLKNAGSYAFNDAGTKMAIVFKKDSKDSLSRDELVMYDFASKGKEVISSDKKYYSVPAFDVSGTQMVFLASDDSLKDGSKHCSVNIYSNGSVKEIMPQSYRSAEGLIINENAAPYFSRSGKRIFLGLGEYRAPKDTTIIDFESARLDIWNWDGLYTPPMQKVRSSSLMNRTYTAKIEIESGELMLLAKGDNERISLVEGGDADWALYVDNGAYALSSYWDSNSFTDAGIISLEDGSKTELWKGKSASPSLSPSGRYITWFDYETSQWYAYNTLTHMEFCLTDKLGVNFYDEDDDHPNYPSSYGRPVWMEDERYFLLADKYDYWKISPDGNGAICITNGYGRANKIQFRYFDPVSDYGFSAAQRKAGFQHLLSQNDPVWFSAFDESTKKNGFAYLKNTQKAASPVCFVDEYTFSSPVKSRNAAVMLYTKGNYRNPSDLYMYKAMTGKKISADFKYDAKLAQSIQSSSSRLTSINPQQAEYRWGDAQLVHWNAYDGTPLDGILVTPDDVKPGEKLPLMIYFYEKNAETLYSYRQPAPSRSTVNISFFVSNGYCVFIPDIVYTVGHPGESAYNCIVSGAEAMCEQFDYIDKDRMAIQGQSWGGYQVAYLVTRTNLFKAAGAGAPVGNMTSAYGGIRWESGMVRAMQYEHGQSRIGKSLWDEGGLDLYIENSPIFHVNKVQTPVLIMANDADGAVPWYQGIEFFSNLRRFSKPAWLLQYNDEAHNLVERRNCKDLSIRLSQFFDHYLKGEPMPAWMKTGVPYWMKGQYYGFEYAE